MVLRRGILINSRSDLSSFSFRAAASNCFMTLPKIDIGMVVFLRWTTLRGCRLRAVGFLRREVALAICFRPSSGSMVSVISTQLPSHHRRIATGDSDRL